MKSLNRHLLTLTLVVFVLAGFAASGFISQSKPKQKTSKKTAVQPKAVTAPASAITWYNMSEGFAKAKKENKILVVDVYTDWCYWCKVMDQKTYADAGIIKKMNEYCVAVKFNPENNGTHIVGSDTLNSDQLASYLNRGGRIPGYPMTYVWKDLGSQNTIAPYTGYLEAPAFSQILNQYIQESK